MALAVERSVCLGRQLEFSLSAERGKCKKFLASADDKESLVPETCVDAIAGVTARRTRVHYPFCGDSLCNRPTAASAAAAKIRNSLRLMSLLIKSYEVVSLN